ncbi:MAG: Glycosyl transferase group 1 [Candidatus Gottesmanbacteria bacterium GW2011_GWC2_39_8]|uniref:Glycosyl transferase group 1 n=1 Tax=Candidatus Gottesmanbacteria bacterium GW2011_GWC2_39_8 TaxID=1618450 RepID=A0A0G0T8U6_9BACT|nr:MAG: Glycosyl transferase group 1 [Candidatus Gottesmanbacteria bacterium GW2011_GWC2_39_8]
MKIYWLHSHFLYSTGGTRFVFEVAKRLKRDYEVEMVVERTSDYWKDKFDQEGITVKEILPFSSNSIVYWFLFPFILLKLIREFKKLVGEKDFIISSMFPMNFVAGKIKSSHLMYCLEPYAFFYDEKMINNLPPVRKIGSKLLAFFYNKYDREGVEKADKILTINQAVATWVKTIYRRQADGVTYLGVDTDFFRPTKDHLLNEKYKGKKIIFHSTDFTLLKGTEFLVKALPEIVRKVPECSVLISETIKEEKRKKDLINLAEKLGVSDKIIFLGHVSYDDLPKYYTLADLVVFSGDPHSRGAANASLTVVEAMACETPVVRSIGCEEEVINEVSGYLTDPRDTSDLAEKCIHVLQNKKLARKMGRKGRERVLKFFQWDKVAEVFKNNILKMTQI